MTIPGRLLSAGAALGLAVALATGALASATNAAKNPSAAKVASTFKGTARPKLHTGKRGSLDVVYIGKVVERDTIFSSVPIEVWNGTGHTLHNLTFTGTATVGGKIVGSGSTNDVEPQNVRSGDVAFGTVTFKNAIPANAHIRVSDKGSGGAGTYQLNTEVTQANIVRSGTSAFVTVSVVGAVKNQTKATLSGPIAVDVYCFSSSGVFTTATTGFLTGTTVSLKHGQTGSFSVRVTAACATYLVAASGFNMAGL